jgi:60S ribosomal export protein NMD3
LDFVSRLLYSYIFISLEKKTGMSYTLYLDPEEFQKSKDSFKLIITPVSLTQDKVSIANHEYIVKILNIHCPSCAKIIGGRFNAIVQIRIQNPKDVTKLDEIMNLVVQIEQSARTENNENFISRIEPVTNGYDLKVSTNTMAKILVSKLQGRYYFEMKSSNRLIGRDSETSADLYRRSTLLRLLPVEKGDSILWEDEPMVINKIIHNRVLLQNVLSGEVKTIKFGDFQRKRWFFQSSNSNE